MVLTVFDRQSECDSTNSNGQWTLFVFLSIYRYFIGYVLTFSSGYVLTFLQPILSLRTCINYYVLTWTIYCSLTAINYFD